MLHSNDRAAQLLVAGRTVIWACAHTIGDDLVARFALDVAVQLLALLARAQSNRGSHARSESDTASILFKLRIIQALLQGKRACPGLVLRAILIGKHRRRVLVLFFNLRVLWQFCILGERDPTHDIGKRPKWWDRAWRKGGGRAVDRWWWVVVGGGRAVDRWWWVGDGWRGRWTLLIGR